MNQDIENIIKSNLPEKKVCNGDDYLKKEGFNQALSQINTSLIADEVLKVVEKPIELLKLILPLAKGYVANNNVGSNKEYIKEVENYLSNLSPNKENEKRDFIYCLDKDCDGYKGGLWIDKLKQDDTHNAFICHNCCKLIPAVNINVERNLLIKENK